MTNETKPTKVVDGPVRISYAHVFTPTSMYPDSDKKKYSVTLLIPKKDKRLIKKINAAVEAAIQQGKQKWGGKIPASLRMPLRDGDDEKPEDENYEGMYFMNATSASKPGIIDLDGEVLTDDDQFYSGCFARFSVNFFPYNTAGNKGVGCGLNNLQKVRDGERLSGRGSAEDDFNDNYKHDENDADDDLMG